MSTSLVVAETRWTRLLRALRLLTPQNDVEHEAGVDFSETIAAQPTYDQLTAMSAASAFPWLAAGVEAKATDLSRLALRCSRGKPGTEGAEIIDHPVLDLLEQPSERMAGTLYRRQMLTDLVLTGSSYQLVLGYPAPASLLRLHPARSRILPLKDGQPGALEYSGQGSPVVYEWDRILNARKPSWEDTPAKLYGLGAVQPLHADLVTDLRVAKMAGTSAETGVPTGVLSPAEKGDTWGAAQVAAIRREYDKQLAGKSGLLIVGGAAKYDPMGWSPRDMEYEKVRLYSRDAQLAVIGVPPSRVGLPGANYATDLNQTRRYWESLIGEASLLEEAWTRLARMFPNSEDVYVFHDFSTVDALQESRSARLDRVQQWWLMGVPLAEAAMLEGFDDLPGNLGEQATPTQAPPEQPPTEQQAASLRAVFGLGEVKQADVPASEVARAARWRGLVAERQAPAERAYTVVLRRFLSAQGKRIADRAGEVLGQQQQAVGGGVVTRGIDEDMDAIFVDAIERGALRSATKPTMLDAVRRAMIAALADVGADAIRPDRERIDRAVEDQLAAMVVQVSDSTKAAIRGIVSTGLDEGLAVNDIQRAIQGAVEFTPMRALRVARTEATRSVTAGSLTAYEQAGADAGITVRKQWLSARDDVVRETHADADGQVVALGEDFELSDGDTGSGPGGFSRAENVVNCRCTVIPITDGEGT